MQKILETVDAQLETSLERLFAFLRIPSISAQPAHKPDCLRAAAWVVNLLAIRRPEELSDGQRYRLRLAKLMESNADVWVADEFGAVLDRETAKVVSYNAQKLARARGVTLMVATTHTDLVEELAPSITVTKRFQERVNITRGVSNP